MQRSLRLCMVNTEVFFMTTKPDFSFKAYIPKMHPEGVKFVLIGAGLTVIFAMFSHLFGFLLAVLTGCVYLFFRDPERVPPEKQGAIVSPADGIVCLIDKKAPPEELDMGNTPVNRVCVFMSVLNVHINRTPIKGKIIKTYYHPGKFLNASLDKASEDNERYLYALETAKGNKMAFVQIAGLVARRIVSLVKEGQNMETGERFGLIRFGSRVDVYLPQGVEVKVSLGQTMIAGETIIGEE